ncbi:MAG: peptidylprolyl isomerase [Gammaproteobacteria bacterium]
MRAVSESITTPHPSIHKPKLNLFTQIVGAALVLGGLLLHGIAGATPHSSETLDKIVAVVEEGVILNSELTNRVEDIIQQLRGNPSQLPPRAILHEQVLNRLIIENLQLQMADKMGIRVSDEKVTEAIEQVASRNNQDLQSFRQTLLANAIDFGDFREQIKRELLISRLQQRVVSQRVQVTDQDVNNFMHSPLGQEQLSAEYHLNHLLIALPESPSAQEVQHAQHLIKQLRERITSGALSFREAALTYSDGQKAREGGDMGWRKLAQLPTLFAEAIQNLPTGGLSKPIRSGAGFHLLHVIDQRGGVEKHVNQLHVRHILITPNAIRHEQQTQALAQNIYQQLLTGATFATLSKSYSDDNATARNGGDLGWITPDAMDPAFQSVLQRQPVGTPSKPFRSRFGWHILEITDRRSEDMSDAFRLKMARQMIFRRTFDEELDGWLRELRQDAFVEIRE